MSGRVVRAASLPLAAVGLAGLGVRIWLAVRPDRSPDHRIAALTAALVTGVALGAAWLLERVRGSRQEWAPGRQAPALPPAPDGRLAAQVADHERKLAFVVAALTDVLRRKDLGGSDLTETTPNLTAIRGGKTG